MSSREHSEAERAVTDALFVLKCIAYDDQHLVDVGRAIDFYVAGDFKSAAILATAMVKGRASKRISKQPFAEARPLAALEEIFRGSHKSTRIEVVRGNAPPRRKWT